MEKTYEHPTPSVRPVNGWIFAESEIQVEPALVAGKPSKIIKHAGEADMMLEQGIRVKFTGRMRALAVSAEAEKKLGLKPGMYFYPSKYVPISPIDENGNAIDAYNKRSFIPEEEYEKIRKDKKLVVPPTCDFFYEEVAYVCR